MQEEKPSTSAATRNVDAPEIDVNAVFNEIALTEEHLTQESYEEGFQTAVERGNTHYFHLGYHKGLQLGTELGFYFGIVKKYLESEDQNLPTKAVRILNTVNTKVRPIIETDVDVDIDQIVETTEWTKSQMKILGSILKVQLIPPSDNSKDITF